MMYFTKEELEDITNKLIENPTRETLKSLSDTYNGVIEQQQVSDNNLVTEVTPVVEVLSDVSVAPIQNEVVDEVLPSANLNAQVVSPVTVVTEMSEGNNLPNFNVPNMDIINTDNVVTNNVNNGMHVPSFELPKLETPVFNNQNNEQINFTGNLFEQPMQNIGNLMQTTDNFNAIPNTIPNTEVSVSPAPFFGVSNEPVNNPIPVEGSVNNMPVMGPSMFGEFEQNNM